MRYFDVPLTIHPYYNCYHISLSSIIFTKSLLLMLLRDIQITFSLQLALKHLLSPYPFHFDLLHHIASIVSVSHIFSTISFLSIPSISSIVSISSTVSIASIANLTYKLLKLPASSYFPHKALTTWFSVPKWLFEVPSPLSPTPTSHLSAALSLFRFLLASCSKQLMLFWGPAPFRRWTPTLQSWSRSTWTLSTR